MVNPSTSIDYQKMTSRSSSPPSLWLFHLCIKYAHVSTILKRNRQHLSFTQQSSSYPTKFCLLLWVSYVLSPQLSSSHISLGSPSMKLCMDLWIAKSTGPFYRSYLTSYLIKPPFYLLFVCVCGFCDTSVRSFLLVTLFIYFLGTSSPDLASTGVHHP